MSAIRGSWGDYIDTGWSMWVIGGAPGEYMAALPYRTEHAQLHIKP